ncbi:MAG TPA: hypothetical protein VGN96_03895, partial [Roseococcus sp.]|nr:hypothetical protein [Roseococcus sp.]
MPTTPTLPEVRDHARRLSSEATCDQASRALQAIAVAADALGAVAGTVDEARNRPTLEDTSDLAAILHDMASDVA